VEIRRWTSPLADVEPGEVVIEALACDLPEAFVARMAARAPGPLWLNLEYLTAEAWAGGVHGLPSPHPRLPLTKYFFMPGYQAGTGGLTREAWLTEERDRFQADPAARSAFWAGLGLPPEIAGETRVSLFCYDNAALPGLLAAWAGEDRPSRVLVPVGKACAGDFRLVRPGGPAATGRDPVPGRPDPACPAHAGPGRLRPPAVGLRPQLRARRGFLRPRPVRGPAPGVAGLSPGGGGPFRQAGGVSSTCTWPAWMPNWRP
jgi:hypothetical protein